MEVEINEALAKKVLDVVDCGLSSGLGGPRPGEMCVEAAVCYAMGMPHGDSPSCVGDVVRKYKLQINDARWSSKAARAKGMRRVAIAQLGSNKIDQAAFARLIVLEAIRQLLPVALLAAARANPSHEKALEIAAFGCEEITEFAQIFGAVKMAMAAADAADDDSAAACAAASYDAAADYADYADAAADYADAAAAAYAYAAYAVASADGSGNCDRILHMAAEICVQALIKLGSPGCEWLALTEAA